MPEKQQKAAGRRLIDHPTRLGALAGIFFRRHIAVGADATGRVVLVRPDSLTVDIGVDTDRAARVANVVKGWDPAQARSITKRPRGSRSSVIGVRIPTETPRDEGAVWSVRSVNERIDEFAAADVPAEPDYVILGSQVVTGNPLGATVSFAGEMAFIGDIIEQNGMPVLLSTAQPADQPEHPLPAARSPRATGRPRILVLDTGLRTAKGLGAKVEHRGLKSSKLHQPWASDPALYAVDDEDEDDDDGHGCLDFEAGHGTFINGILQRHCPDAEVHSVGVLSSFGDGEISGVLAALDRAIRLCGPFDIVVMSFGAFLPDDESALFRRALLELLGDSLGVAAAGNQQTCRPYFPAGFPEIVSVGALAADGRAWFSNFGPWVDACAPGVDVVSTFFEHFDEVIDGRTTRSYRGWARWSGTSFSAPKVAAAIAEEQYRNGGTAADAWRRLSTDYHKLRVPDLGVVFNL